MSVVWTNRRPARHRDRFSGRAHAKGGPRGGPGHRGRLVFAAVDRRDVRQRVDRGRAGRSPGSPLPGAGRPPVLVGYICVWVVTDELHINNSGGPPAWRKRASRESCSARHCEQGRRGARGWRSWRSARPTWRPQALYRQARFEPVGVRPRYYTHPVEDAVVMRRTGL